MRTSRRQQYVIFMTVVSPLLRLLPFSRLIPDPFPAILDDAITRSPCYHSFVTFFLSFFLSNTQHFFCKHKESNLFSLIDIFCSILQKQRGFSSSSLSVLGFFFARVKLRDALTFAELDSDRKKYRTFSLLASEKKKKRRKKETIRGDGVGMDCEDACRSSIVLLSLPPTLSRFSSFSSSRRKERHCNRP